MATHIRGSSATCTGTCVSRLRRSSKSLSKAPPPASIIPRSMMSEASSGGVRSRVSRTAAMTASTGTLIASRTSSLVMTMVLGRPVTRSRPLISADSSPSSKRKALPSSIFNCSAVCEPMASLYSFWMYVVIASSISSPAILMEDLVTIPPREITATSLVPPPTSTTMDPWASLTGIPAPIAAARGSSMVYACRAPADSVASLTARSSTPVTPLGTHTTTLGPIRDFKSLRRGCALRMKYESIFSVTSKSAMTPSFKGRMATMLPGVRPNILFAALPTATTLSVLLSIATTEGSERTIPCPLTNTSVFAVPRSTAASRPNSLPNISLPSSLRGYPSPYCAHAIAGSLQNLSLSFCGQDFLGPAQGGVGSRKTDSGEGEDDRMQDLLLRDADAKQLADMRTHPALRLRAHSYTELDQAAFLLT